MMLAMQVSHSLDFPRQSRRPFFSKAGSMAVGRVVARDQLMFAFLGVVTYERIFATQIGETERCPK
jgi:hypothetical protein